jgi:hypothetical protein
MRDFLEKLTLALAPIALTHVLDVRKARAVAADTSAESFAAYVAARRVSL